jgi:histidine triad (HIT) family protein
MADCIFCKVAEGAIESKRVYEDGDIVAFHDINKMAPVHILVIPRQHIASLLDIDAKDDALLIKMHKIAIQLAKQFNIAESGFRLVLNCNKDAGQSVDHIHLHLLGGRALGWPPG